MKRKSVVVACAVILMTSACTKDPLNNLSDEESRIYITQRDSTVNFHTFKTFSIADSVAYISNNQLVTRYNAVDSQFISAIKNEMHHRGFVLVAKNQKPDLGITVSRIYSTYQGIVEYSNSYYDYWDPFYWGYAGSSYFFPPSYGVYQVTEGALSIDMLNLKDAPVTNQIRSVWSGLIRGSGIFNAQNVGAQVQTLFDQSSYLQSIP